MDQPTLQSLIREVGRGPRSARNLSREQARTLFSAMLDGEIPDLQLGAILMAMRIKGESIDELAGFLDAAHAICQQLTAPTIDAQQSIPLIIPAYNGARQLPNLTPLLALLLARQGVPVLIHGLEQDPGRVTTVEIFKALGISALDQPQSITTRLAQDHLALVNIATLAPKLAHLLSLRYRIGLRSSGHTIVKMLQPFTTNALRLVSVTHPDYRQRMREFFTGHARHALLLRGAEGEVVAHPRREPQIEWLDGVSTQLWREDADTTAQLPSERDAETTAQWIRQALEGKHPIPRAIQHQVQCCVQALALCN